MYGRQDTEIWNILLRSNSSNFETKLPGISCAQSLPCLPFHLKLANQESGHLTWEEVSRVETSLWQLVACKHHINGDHFQCELSTLGEVSAFARIWRVILFSCNEMLKAAERDAKKKLNVARESVIFIQGCWGCKSIPLWQFIGQNCQGCDTASHAKWHKKNPDHNSTKFYTWRTCPGSDRQKFETTKLGDSSWNMAIH